MRVQTKTRTQFLPQAKDAGWSVRLCDLSEGSYVSISVGGVSDRKNNSNATLKPGQLKDHLAIWSWVCENDSAMAGPLPAGKFDTCQAYSVDLGKPLVFQVGHLGDGYQKWVHQSIVCKESPRFFQSDLMESLTKTLWWVIPLVWMPVVFWSQVVALQRGLPLEKLLTTVPTGIFIWTFIEYFLHRFLFHVKTSNYWWNTVHYLLHGCHHKHPMDSYRLVFPPALTAVFSSIIYAVLSLFFSRRWSPSVFGGGLFGYIIYDVSHYFIHHGSPIDKLTRRIKRYHLNHHFKMQSHGFGITSPLWDWVFGTLPPPLKLQSRVGLSADFTTHQ